ncbi:MAG TPA: Ig-like domain-containing protein, partial [Gemmata sp.]|nr:Ig-like domain-containing protein [Gemmata sp.]
MRQPRSIAVLIALLGTVASAATLNAADAPLPSPGEVKSIAIYPEKVSLTGADAAAQLVVTATLTSGRLVDLTHDVKYAVADGKSGSVLETGRVLPRANGKTEIVATYGDKSARVPLETKSLGENLPLNFGNQIVPIFTKLGCNSGGCHGKLAGQNGFRLSLLGFEPELDFATLVKEGRGRRLFPANPDASLFMMKA